MPFKIFIQLYFPRPRIAIENGHLVLESGRDKNITLRTLGSGAVHFLSSDASGGITDGSAGEGGRGGGSVVSIGGVNTQVRQ